MARGQKNANYKTMKGVFLLYLNKKIIPQFLKGTLFKVLTLYVI